MVSIAIALHLLGVVVWVGGMFFAHMALRPAAVETLEPPFRLPLLRQTLENFFQWVWIAIGVILATGYGLLLGPLYGTASGVGYLHLMQALGLIMSGLFVYLFFVPYQLFNREVKEKNFPAAGAAMAKIKTIITINLSLGLITVFVGASKLF